MNTKILRYILLAAMAGGVLLLIQARSRKPGPATGPDKGKTFTVAFYNMENLFDTEDDPATQDEEFLPAGTYGWTPERYRRKLANMARVIDQLGSEAGPDVLGMCEVENKQVLEDLVATGNLKKKGYGIVHSDSPDERGIDCALIYKQKRFLLLYQKAYPVPFPESRELATRDILLVKGILDKKYDITFIVNHWPSRREGAEASAWRRERAAQTARQVVDSILLLDPGANMVLMGDFNDEPADASIRKTLKAGRDSIEASSTWLYNCMAPLAAAGKGTLKFMGEWNLFDQMIVSAAMINQKATLQYRGGTAGIYNPEWMRQTNPGEWKDAPKRTFIRHRYMEDGYSDHFPVYLQLTY
jgi:predicted extracellular nuclease